MTPDFLRRGAPAAVLRALPGARAVGGAVRDHLAGLPIHDVDVAVPLPPEEVTRALRAAGLKVFETGLKHGTVTAVLDRQPVEVTSLRRDVVTDGRHAEVEWTDDWHEDAARRDFTINAMSMGLDGVLLDYFGGRADLAAGRVRFVGEARQRLAEDYLRALRFFRFWARYGRGEPDAEALDAIREAVPGLARLSVERVWMELKRLLAADDPTGGFRWMAQTGVFEAVLPEIHYPGLLGIQRLAAAGAPHIPCLWLAAMIPLDVQDVGEPIARRLKFSAEERDDLIHVHDTMGGQPTMPAPDEASRRRWLISRGDRHTAMLEVWLHEARTGMSSAELRAWMDATPDLTMPVMGRDAVAMGIPPGAELGRLLHALRAWWEADGARAPREACLAKLRELANLPPA